MSTLTTHIGQRSLTIHGLEKQLVFESVERGQSIALKAIGATTEAVISSDPDNLITAGTDQGLYVSQNLDGGTFN